MDAPLLPPIHLAPEADADVLYLQGSWRLDRAAAIAEAVAALPLRPERACVLDGSRLQDLDTTAGFLLFHHLDEAGFAAETIATRHMDERHARLLRLVHERMRAAPVKAPVVAPNVVQRVGRATLRMARELADHNAFVGELALELLALLKRPRLFRFRETVSQFESATIDAIPIVALVTFLIGVVFAYLLGVQAQRYGATIFVVDGVGLAICRELSPILVAVIVAGRSGAAFTAQIGSMKVQEETDAISTLGLSTIQVLVIPRLIALAVGLPMLVFVGDLAGIAGGMLISTAQLGISIPSFTNRLHATLDLSAVVIGLAKAPVFALFIAMIACQMGMSVARDARSVGEHTTSTVVQSIVWVIVLDAIFAIILQRLDI
ncbi:MAG TPA: ABC transporter permease [Burkholderiaceae bacterium]|nr:ABC transporter permease [Burkholderiaceae bacterium]